MIYSIAKSEWEKVEMLFDQKNEKIQKLEKELRIKEQTEKLYLEKIDELSRKLKECERKQEGQVFVSSIDLLV